jgi:hypothetical protein
MAQADSVPTPNHAPNPDASAQQSTTLRRIRIKPADRRYFIGGSDARIITGDDEAVLLRLWREKRGELEPEDLSSNLVVQLGVVTEDLNRRWYQANTGQVLTDVQRQIRHPALHSRRPGRGNRRGMPCSRWSALPARMIWTRPIYCRQLRRKAKPAVPWEIKRAVSMAAKGT